MENVIIKIRFKVEKTSPNLDEPVISLKESWFS